MRSAIAFLVTLFSAGAAMAHTGHGATSGLAAGLTHPLTGLDHLLAMVAVGLLAFHLKGRALWLLPLGFLGMMAVGGGMALAGIGLPLVELGIVGSVIVLGALIASGSNLPTAAALALVGGFALFHGHAHGAEMPLSASAGLYGLGFIAATAFLHGSGLVAGMAMQAASARHGRGLGRAAGALASAVGIAMLAGIL